MYISHTTINILCFIFIGMIGYLIYLKRQIQWYNTESRYNDYIWNATICFLHILIYEGKYKTEQDGKYRYGSFKIGGEALKKKILDTLRNHETFKMSYWYWNKKKKLVDSDYMNDIVQGITLNLEYIDHPDRFGLIGDNSPLDIYTEERYREIYKKQSNTSRM